MAPATTDPVPAAAPPYRFGLYAASTLLNAPERVSPLWYRVGGCTPGAQWDPTCGVEQDAKSAPEAEWKSADPFVVYDGATCLRVGFDDGEQLARARQAFSEQRQVESWLWQHLAQDDPQLVYPAGSTASSPLEALEALEGQLAASTGQVGIIHIPRGLSPALVPPLWRDGAVWRTPAGTPVVFGGGYGYGGPPDGEAAEGTGWMYATGPVSIYRSPVRYLGGDDGGFDTTTNRVWHIAERQITVTVDCPVLAAAFTWENQPPEPVPPPLPTRLKVTAALADPADRWTWTATVTGADASPVDLDWGDGASEPVTTTGGTGSATHTYAKDP